MKKSFKDICDGLLVDKQSFNFESGDKVAFDVDYRDPANEFLRECSESDREKIIRNINHARETNDPKVFKKITSVIWEFRTRTGNIRYRLLAFWLKRPHNRPLVVITNGFIKKTSKVPGDELARALKIKSEYFN